MKSRWVRWMMLLLCLCLGGTLVGCGGENHSPSSPDPGGGELSPIIPPVEKPVQFDRPQRPTRLVETTGLIRADQARSDFGVNGSDLTVAVLDTGLRTTHVDFAGKVVAQRNFTSDNGGDENNAADGHGHGTNVAGIIVANGDHTGIAPGANVIPLKVLNNTGSGSWTDVAEALQWVIDNRGTYDITAVNMSLGAGNYMDPPDDSSYGIRSRIQTLRAANVAVVIAAGNSFYTYSSQQGMAFPAISPESVSVGAVYDANEGGFLYSSGARAYSTGPDRICPFSQRLHESVRATNRTDVFAPGAVLTSSGINNDHGESEMHGTSQAAPVTAGVILLLQEYYLDHVGVLPSVDELENWLRDGAVTINDGDDEDDNVTNTGLDFPRVDAVNAFPSVNTPPTMTNGDVGPERGDPGDTFTYAVTYTDADNDAPSFVRVHIQRDGTELSGSPYAMNAASGGDGDYTNGEGYEYVTTLDEAGNYSYWFGASDGTDTVQTDEASGPTVWAIIAREGFEGPFPTEGWWVWDQDGLQNGEYYWGKEDSHPHRGRWAAWCAADGASPRPFGGYPNHGLSWMVYGPFSLKDAAAAELEFFCDYEIEAAGDTFFYGHSTDGRNFEGQRVSGASGGYVETVFDLSSVCGEAEVWIALLFVSDAVGTARGVWIDDLVLRKR